MCRKLDPSSHSGLWRVVQAGQRKFSAARWAAIGAAVPMGLAALPADIAGPLLFLCSDLRAYVTGEIMAVDGGVARRAPPMPNLRGIA